ncbi:Low temperature requirement A [Venturia nashicola]|nr:Low temperature requirement A [Venturia nashicola]
MEDSLALKTGEVQKKWQADDLKAAEEAQLPAYQTPFTCYDENQQRSLHLRQSSNLLELFFDLFLAANLATFTESHSIVDKGSLVAYIGFFLIIWSTWFQITLHDVRFAQDSVYERVCKILQFMVFVAFALVGSNFSPPEGEDAHGGPNSEAGGAHKRSAGSGAPKEARIQHLNFWLLSITLCFSRGLLAMQYIVLYFSKTRPNRLRIPLLLNVVVFLVSGAIFIGLADVFSAKAAAEAEAGVSRAYITWYLVLLFELIGIIQISTIWKEINFENTHLTERMGLLTFIVIGEGAIGASKTTVEMMGGRVLTAEPIFLITCILLILVLLWAVYFDNLPTKPHSSTWQQIWACLHLPLHLSFVGILEGSRQVAMMRYISHALRSFASSANKQCLKQHLDGAELSNILLKLIQKYEFGVMHPTAGEFLVMKEDIAAIGNAKGICSAANTAGVTTVFFANAESKGFGAFQELLYHFARALFISDGAEEVPKSRKGRDGFELLERSIITVYLYYWASVLAMLLTLTILYRLNRPTDNDIGDFLSYVGRTSMAILAVALISIYGNTIAWTDFIASSAMLPTLCSMIAIVLAFDWLGRRLRVKKIRKLVDEREQIESRQVKDKLELEIMGQSQSQSDEWIENVEPAHHSNTLIDS